LNKNKPTKLHNNFVQQHVSGNIINLKNVIYYITTNY